MTTTYSAKIIADTASVNDRLTTMEVVFPRFILPEMTRHRVFSFSVESSRARSLTKTIELVDEDPFVPEYWGKHQTGMSAREEVSDSTADLAIWDWTQAAINAVDTAKRLQDLGLHKQLVNRILEPFMWTTAIISSTEWNNFFDLRIHEDAQPEIQRTAQEMKHALQHSIPTEASGGDWHLPYVTDEEKSNFDLATLHAMSAARCARVSYKNQDSKDTEKDIALFKRLVESKHWSPLEHVAQVRWSDCDRNFIGFKQLREIYDS